MIRNAIKSFSTFRHHSFLDQLGLIPVLISLKFLSSGITGGDIGEKGKKLAIPKAKGS